MIGHTNTSPVSHHSSHHPDNLTINLSTSITATCLPASMCVHFQSWNRCSSCFLTFNRRRNRVPCWNGSLSRWRIHRHGLACRSGWYERADDEVYTHVSCAACSMAANSVDEKTAIETGRMASLGGSRVAMRRTNSLRRMVIRWSWREALYGRSVRKDKSRLRPRIWMPRY